MITFIVMNNRIRSVPYRGRIVASDGVVNLTIISGNIVVLFKEVMSGVISIIVNLCFNVFHCNLKIVVLVWT